MAASCWRVRSPVEPNQERARAIIASRTCWAAAGGMSWPKVNLGSGDLNLGAQG